MWSVMCVGVYSVPPPLDSQNHQLAELCYWLEPVKELSSDETSISSLVEYIKRFCYISSSDATIGLGSINNFNHDHCVKFNTIITVL